jgi:hypothetical protein
MDFHAVYVGIVGQRFGSVDSLMDNANTAFSSMAVTGTDETLSSLPRNCLLIARIAVMM